MTQRSATTKYNGRCNVEYGTSISSNTGLFINKDFYNNLVKACDPSEVTPLS